MRILFNIFAFFLLVFDVSAQTGPGGVGKTDGTSNLRWWYDANSASYADGASVSSLNDLSGYGNNLTASGVEMPTFVSSTSAINNKASLSFDVNDELESTYQGNSSETMSYFIVLNHTQTNSTVRVAVQQGGRNTVSARNGKLKDYVGANNHISANTSNGSWLIHSRTFSGGTVGTTVSNGIVYYLNGTQSDVFNYRIENRTSNTWIGGNGTGGGTGLMGSIAEVMKFTKKVNSAERIIIENYLSAKYNIALTSNDKYAGDNSINGDYDKNIIGIGTESDGSHTSSNDNKGLVISQNTGFGNGDYLFAGHSVDVNTTNLTDIGGVTGLEARWERVWYFDITDGGTTNTVDISFDFTDAGSLLLPSQASNYVLLYRSGQSGNWTNASSGITPVISGDRVTFSGITLSNGDGYYTLGSLDLANSTLPVELISFDAVKEDIGIVLHWQTATETNNDYFTIEKSNNSVEWLEISKINGAGTSNQINKYEFVDYDTNGEIIYYRLKQTDYDGENKYIKTLALNIESKQKIDFVIKHNYANDYIIVEGENIYGKQYYIYNSHGVICSEGVCNSDSNKIEIYNLEKGFYFVRIANITYKFVRI